VRGQRTDRNGPFLARELVSLGFAPARLTIVGDDPDDLEAAFREALAADLVVLSGGLGPTHDDRTVEVIARATGRELAVDQALHAEIEAVSRAISQRLGRPYAHFLPGIRKQATLPAGAVSLGLAGTAPGVLLEEGDGLVVVLPGPPGELQRLWRVAVESEPMRRLLDRVPASSERVLRVYGLTESAVANAFADAGGEGDGLEVTICAHDWEIRVDLVAGPDGEDRAAAVESALVEALGERVFARDGRALEEIVLEACRGRGWTLATAESCTGGLVAARLTEVPGSSDVVLGGIVAYADRIKEAELGVPPDTLERHGAVSAETAEALAEGARRRFGADVGVGITGVAGPGGGSAEKPVGLVFLHVSSPAGAKARELNLPGDRAAVRGRATAAALHLVRRLAG
jgi:nicotinamide-nucleotide amidase